jgi:hypothetical protein
MRANEIILRSRHEPDSLTQGIAISPPAERLAVTLEDRGDV